ncbi:MAG: endonuclease MutS2 [Clostridia bacterium]|jgi:DNA mismatch repair protein MutS2|nr:endonuclease MutS2 [Clostridia bacterium]
MNEKCIKTLEYNKIISMLCDNTVSDMGRDIAETLLPSSDINEVKELQQETTEAVNLILKKGNAPLSGIYDIRVPLRKVKMGSSLDPGELLKIAYTLRSCRILKNYISEDKGEQQFPIIEYYIDTLSHFKNIEESIFNAIENEEEISDRASSLLHSIRRKIKDKSAGIKEKLNHMVTSSAYSKYLQEGIVTVRGDRHVIPVKQEYRAQVPGIIHDQSASGATLFIEPMVIVEMQNELKQLRLSEAEEIERILYELTGFVGEKYESIKLNAEILATLDFIFAKAKLSLEFRCVEPKVNDKGIINIKKARHPLIDAKKVVPIDIYMGESFNTLVITGPNTGGKTVTLKTVGLLSLMAQAGLHIPAGDYSEVAVFDEVFADIGDEQSIEQSLSTFSSHMTNIVSILNNITKNSLVLFDELGAGTDPTEGAALAMSILELLYKKDIRTAATTHYSELKVYALSTPGVCNASMEFDVATLRPTYKLLIGIPGKSNAFEISQKLGLSGDIIHRAKEFISKEDIEFEDVIKDLQENRKKMQEESDLASRMRMDIERSKKELDNKLGKMEEQKERILRDAQREALAIVKRSKEEANQIIRELREAMEKEAADKALVIEQARTKLKQKQDEAEEKIGEAVLGKVSHKPPKKLKLGDTVKIVNLNQKGYVLTLPDEQGNLMVQAGIMKVSVNINNLTLDQEEKQTAKKQANLHLSSEKARSISAQIDVRGQTLEEAIMNVDKYIDDAYLAGAGQITIIHGKGTGTLRAGINQMLRSNSHVKSFRVGAFNEGGSGATIVEIKS